MKIILHYSNDPPFVLGDHEKKGLGGTENFACYVARHLALQGHEVKFYNRANVDTTIENVKWANIDKFNPNEECDVLVSFRMRDVFQTTLAAKHKVLILADTESHGLGKDVRAGRIDEVVFVSQFQCDKISMEEGIVGNPGIVVSSNGIDMSEFELKSYQFKPGKCIFLSTPERGLDNLLELWPFIEDNVKSESDIIPELHIFSSFMGWGVSAEDNENMSMSQYTKVQELIDAGHNIINHKHVAKDELRLHQLESHVMLYPSNFLETYCISMTECMAAGTIPVVSGKGALPERIVDGENGVIVGDSDSDAYSLGYRMIYVNAAVRILTLSEGERRRMSQLAIDSVQEYDYAKVVKELADRWETNA